ncbi:hypothetical protein [Alkalimonas mucilaginosa]|uniref:Lipoprotein n=1 Tax=Alkalimonas mucilaginosa TaxID=3057676 RepID=A0ABU7JES2_9GAMM|nr:hypothetical protein [Alkalimonas sp. MEB004]MEE2024174.1 hypothetical protein [Alkalimonas sp. MEB004]
MKKNQIFTKLAIVTAIAVALSACGGGGSSEPAPPSQGVTPPPQGVTPPTARFLTVSGKAIDGYIVGGTVFLDINGNGIADPDEPQKLTEEAGDYYLEIPEDFAECVAYSALIVDVPVGAFDEDLGEVTEAYQIILQPTFEPITEADFRDGLTRNISPLTTVVWEAIERSYPRTIEEKHCHYLKNHVEEVQTLKNEIEETVRGLVSFYNLSADRLYADFIADNDSVAYHAAQDIMQGLKAAYRHKTELRKTYPTANEVRVFVYRSTQHDEYFNVSNGWYRDEIIFLGSEDFIERVKLVDSPNLDEVDFVLAKFHELGQPWNDQSLKGWLSIRQDTYRDPDGGYRCGNIERVSFDFEQTHYELANIVPTVSFPALEQCVNNNFEMPYERGLSIRINEEDGGSTGAEFSFRESQPVFFDLPDWINVKEKPTLPATELMQFFDLLGYEYDSEVRVSTEYWRKSKIQNGVAIHKYSDGRWERETELDDGTRLFECSVDGQSWQPCD